MEEYIGLDVSMKETAVSIRGGGQRVWPRDKSRCLRRPSGFRRIRQEAPFTWPAIRDGVMTLNRAQFEALFSDLDWRRVKALEARRPAAAE